MPCIRVQGLAADRPRLGRQHPEHQLLGDQHTDQNQQRETLRDLLWAQDRLDSADRDTHGRQEKNRGDHERGQRFRLAQSVWISVRLGHRADPEPTPNQKPAEDVENRLHAVRDEGKGISDDPGCDLRGRKKGARHDADRRYTCALSNRSVELFGRAETSSCVIHTWKM